VPIVGDLLQHNRGWHDRRHSIAAISTVADCVPVDLVDNVALVRQMIYVAARIDGAAFAGMADPGLGVGKREGTVNRLGGSIVEAVVVDVFIQRSVVSGWSLAAINENTMDH